ncbi:MAG: transposase [Gammaproteobacteria bacterium]|nr:transposase [Gammaproteobacteria bacterium]
MSWGFRYNWAILALLVRALRRQWPRVEIVLCGDSGFCHWKMLRWCEHYGVKCLVGITRNRRLLALAVPWTRLAEDHYEATGARSSAGLRCCTTVPAAGAGNGA